jgi:hypothetical protein
MKLSIVSGVDVTFYGIQIRCGDRMDMSCRESSLWGRRATSSPLGRLDG